MIKSFEIENFRLFEHLKVNRLGRVNLVVGKNNAGKSAFLEAVLLFRTKFDLEKCSQLLKNRFELEDVSSISSSKGLFYDPLGHFFPGHVIPEIGDKMIFVSDENKLSVESAVYVVEEVVDTENRISTRKIRYLGKGDSLVSAQRCLRIDFGDDSFPVSLGRTASHPRLVYDGRLDLFLASRIEKAKWLPSNGLSDEEAEEAWNDVFGADRERVILEELRLLEPGLQKIWFAKSEKADRRIPVAKLKDISVAIPLKSLGEGVTRVLHLLSSVVSCEGGVLLIDEFENGLHWNVQPKVWKMIFELAKKLDVQVFATTHSRDCVAGFHEAWKKNEKEGAFLRLMREENRKPVEEYSLEQLRKSIEIDVEVR